MIIEFTGAPCSGKSEISYQLGSLLVEDGSSVCQNQYHLSHGSPGKRQIVKLLTSFKECICHPYRSLLALRHIKSMGIWLNYLYIVGSKANCDYLILEQGICQCASSLFDGIDITIDSVAKAMNALLPDQPDRKFVFVHVSAKTVLDRMALRPDYDQPFYAETEDPAGAIEKAVSITKLLETVIMQKYGIENVISVSNEENGQSHLASKRIYAWLKDKR